MRSNIVKIPVQRNRLIRRGSRGWEAGQAKAALPLRKKGFLFPAKPSQPSGKTRCGAWGLQTTAIKTKTNPKGMLTRTDKLPIVPVNGHCSIRKSVSSPWRSVSLLNQVSIYVEKQSDVPQIISQTLKVEIQSFNRQTLALYSYQPNELQKKPSWVRCS